MRTMWKYIRPARHRPGYIRARKHMLAVAAVLAAVVGLACTGPGVPAEDPKPIPNPQPAPAVTPILAALKLIPFVFAEAAAGDPYAASGAAVLAAFPSENGEPA